jgi:hypothetical protein
MQEGSWVSALQISRRTGAKKGCAFRRFMAARICVAELSHPDHEPGRGNNVHLGYTTTQVTPHTHLMMPAMMYASSHRTAYCPTSTCCLPSFLTGSCLCNVLRKARASMHANTTYTRDASGKALHARMLRALHAAAYAAASSMSHFQATQVH